MTLDDLSSDFEIAGVEVRNSGFAGIMAKTDPSCDVATQARQFYHEKCKLHNNYIHQTGRRRALCRKFFLCQRAFSFPVVRFYLMMY
jgi:ribosomal protein S14